jgi:2-dehydro-3-deoxygluconokinase
MHQPLRVVLFGECMLELQGEPFQTLRQSMGGDTWNTAVYLARCSRRSDLQVAYATALGDDPFSAEMRRRWADEGLALHLLRELPGRLPGLYMIELDARGERRFHFWRDQSAARAYFEELSSPLEDAKAEIDLLYVSGISLAILSPAARVRLLALMQALRARGAQVVFDNNYRPRLWDSADTARGVFNQALALASTALITLDDHQTLFAPESEAAALAHAQALPVPELVIKRGAAPTLAREAGATAWAEAATEPVPRVVDTTAAGDSFAAGYLSRRLLGHSAAAAARFGNRLAARVIQHRGAVIDAREMADLMGESAAG